GLVDCRRQSAPLSQRADPTGDVAGCALGLGAVGHLGALADRPEVELPVGGGDEDLQLPADRGEERLEQARGPDTGRSGNGDRVVRLAGIDALVLVDREVDARRPRGLDRRGHGAVVKLSRGCDRTRQRRRYNDMVRFRTTLVVLASLTLLGAAAPAQAASGRLVAFRSCPDLVNYAKANAARFVGPYGLGGSAALRSSVPGIVNAAAPTAKADNATPQEGVDYSGTNVQETGV